MKKIGIANMSEVLRGFDLRFEQINDDIADMWFKSGLEAIEQARQNADFQNWTNDLRSSFGVAVAIDGNIVRSDFALRGDGLEGDGRAGLEEAKKYVNELMTGRSEGVTLVIVAGRYYAGFVEARGRNVLTAYTLGVANELVQKIKQYAK